MSEVHDSPLLDTLVEAGGVTTSYHGRTLVRHFGEPAAEYDAATERVAIFDRGHRTRLTVSGRAPGQMLNGVLTGRIPDPPATVDDDVSRLMATYHAVLTPKGKMLTDLWALLPGVEESPGYLLDVPVAGREALTAEFTRVLPPRFARVEDRSAELGSVTLVGPGAADLATRLALGLRVEPAELRDGAEGDGWVVGEPAAGLVVVKTAEVWPDAYTLYGPVEAIDSFWRRAVESGVRPAGLGVWSTLRVEAGRPVYGTDMDDRTIPTEAGIDGRAIDHQKGCYTGQEVIVRIRDRGHVNRNLRRLELGDVPTPALGTELYAAGDDSGKVVGTITSAVQSPKYGGVVALAYVRRGVETVTLDGREVTVPTH